MSRLSAYKAKRDLRRTPEPSGRKDRSRAGELIFVIQRHKATRLHYDLRLEMEGVLKSWAVPKGPSLDPKHRRLAMMVEDHPYDYKDFEGVIPEGNYGAGIVEIWDKGTYEPVNAKGETISEKAALADLRKGSLKFRLQGKKLKGEFAIVHMARGREENAWLLIKHRDANVIADYDSEEHVPRDSPINKALKAKSAGGRTARSRTTTRTANSKRTRRMPDKIREPIKPMLARLHDAPFDDREWIFEVKWDGYRAIAEVDGSDVKLYSRNGLSFNAAYPRVVEALAGLKAPVVLDGEIVALDKHGMPSFQGLQNSMDDRSVDIVYQVFDILAADGDDLRALPLLERKKVLHRLLKDHRRIRYSDHVQGDGKHFFELIVERGLEGVIAKRADSKYVEGARNSSWLKIKHHVGQEAVIGGYTAPRGSREHFGSLLLGVKDKGKFRYVGHAGTGFSRKTLSSLMMRMAPLVRGTSPFDDKVPINAPAVWLEPRLVCQVKFTEWTKDGIMRHPVYLGLREDKHAGEVVMEQVAADRKKEKVAQRKERSTRTAMDPSPVKGERIVTVGRRKLKLTNQDKVYWPDEGYTKGDLVDYYAAMHRYILPYLKDRPQSLKRDPGGITGKGFYQKEAGEDIPDWVHTEAMASKSRRDVINYIICNDKATLLYLANLGCIELNPWSSRYQTPDRPEHIVIDLDPGERTTFDQVIEAALAVKVICDEIGAPAYCKTSGASGIHIYLPTKAKHTYEQLLPLAEGIAVRTSELLPNTTTVERTIAKRGGRLYVDHLQNRKGQTLASAYSVRPVPGATVSTPLDWKEVRPGLDKGALNIKTVPKRVERRGDLFSGVLGTSIDLKKCLARLENI